MDVIGRAGEPLGATFNEPVELRGATGVRFACLYENAGDQVVGWGTGDQEMCAVVLFTDSDRAWIGGVPAGSPSAVIGSDGGVTQLAATCRVTAP